MLQYVYVPTYVRVLLSTVLTRVYRRQSTASCVSEVSPVQLRRRCRNPVTILPAQLLLYRGACLGDLTVPGRIVRSRYPTDSAVQLRRESHALRVLLGCLLDKHETVHIDTIHSQKYPTV